MNLIVRKENVLSFILYNYFFIYVNILNLTTFKNLTNF